MNVFMWGDVTAINNHAAQLQTLKYICTQAYT